MARNDGIDRTSVRNVNLTSAKIGNAQRHNEREKESYTNADIVPERAGMNIHFKEPSGSYAEMFEKLKTDKVISTRGLKDDACLYGELIFDVNSAYFHNHGGYDFAKQFYTDAYKSAIEIVGGEQYILSAVMHADERNSAMSDALGQDVYHYHLHVVYIPVVEKQILWSKRCKDKSLVGAVKETIMQVSSSKKWQSHPAMDEQGKPILQKNEKPVLRKSYSVLQDDFFNAMRKAGYTDVERGERGSTEEHLTVAQFKVEREQERLVVLENQVTKKTQVLQRIEQKTKAQKSAVTTFAEIDNMGRKTLMGKVELSQSEAKELKKLAKKGVKADGTISDLERDLQSARRDAQIWRRRYEELKEQTKDFMVALKRAPMQVKEFISTMMKYGRVEPRRSPDIRKPTVER
ncbi:recombinase [Clostridiaceae bacterium]|nr:recombinase [Clostridiaceae bacterium]